MHFSWITLFYTILGATSVFAIMPAAPAQEPPLIGLEDEQMAFGFNVQPDRPILAGGLSIEAEVIPELRDKIKEFSLQIKDDITELSLQNNPNRIAEKYLKNFRYAMRFIRLIPISFRSQVVAGTNYYIKTAFGYQCFTVEMFEPLPTTPSTNNINYRRTTGPVPCSSE